MKDIERVAREYIETRHVIAEFLAEFEERPRRSAHTEAADYLVARLAAHEPPILLSMDEE